MQALKAFEMLEEAACDSSFCSSSSKVKGIITGKSSSSSSIGMPSPIAKVSKTAKAQSATSTPISTESNRLKITTPPEYEDDHSLGRSLVDDIQKFLQNRGAVITEDNGGNTSPEEEEDTLKEGVDSVVTTDRSSDEDDVVGDHVPTG